VNDAPSFTLAANDTAAENSGAHSVPGFASAISAGAINEAGQTLTFNLSGNANAALFAVAPAIAPNGTLSYTLAPNVTGTATIDVTLSDNGGGTDTSAPQSFTITVTAQPDAPTFVADPYAFSTTAGASNGTVIGTVSATDSDAGDTLTYSIQTSSAPGAVTIDATTGVITVANSALITTSGSPILLTVRVVDSTNRADAANVTITVDPPLGIQIFADGFED
jgi:large repetitive protein